MGRPNDLFGGVDVLLVGDWLQQSPVAGQAAFLPVEPIQRSTCTQREYDAYLNRVRGAEAYSAINTVVILTDNMRHRGDPTWRGILNKWRTGQHDQADIDIVNQIAFDENWRLRPTGLRSYCPIIVTSNTLRAEFNDSAIRSFCKQARTSLHRFPATVTRSRHRLTAAQRRSLEHIRDDKTNGMPMVLEIAVGSVVQCTKNVSPMLKLANGSIGTVISFSSAKDDAVEICSTDGVEVHYHSMPPDMVFVKLKDYSSESLMPGLPPGVVPVVVRDESGVVVRMPGRSFSLSVTQVPLVPAYALTTEKCQGLTVESMVLAPLRHHTRPNPQKTSLYVGVTRVKSLNHLYLMTPLTKSFLNYFTPGDEIMEETRRLERLERDDEDVPIALTSNMRTRAP